MRVYSVIRTIPPKKVSLSMHQSSQLEEEKKLTNRRSERVFEFCFAVVTGLVGGFFGLVTVWFASSVVTSRNVDAGSFIFFMVLLCISLWFLKLTYKLAFHKTTHLLSTVELKVTGWFFVLFPPLAAIIYIVNGQAEDLLTSLPPSLPACLYGYYALKAAKNRKLQTADPGA
jgi:hypothetical protein